MYKQGRSPIQRTNGRTCRIFQRRWNQALPDNNRCLAPDAMLHHQDFRCGRWICTSACFHHQNRNLQQTHPRSAQGVRLVLTRFPVWDCHWSLCPVGRRVLPLCQLATICCTRCRYGHPTLSKAICKCPNCNPNCYPPAKPSRAPGGSGHL